MQNNHGDLIRYTLLAYSAVMTQSVCASTIDTENKQHLRLEEIVVTARKRQEPLQDAPLSVSAFNEDMLHRMGVTDLSDLSTNVPSLSLAPFPNSSSALTVYMRGVGTVDSEQIARDPGVGIYLDDVYLGRAQGLVSDIANIERVEILRGPQGTLYGRNTIGGAIKFVTARPSGELAVSQQFSVGNRDLARSVTQVDLPRMGSFSMSVGAFLSAEGGTVDNAGGGPDFGERDKKGHRFAALWAPTDQFSLSYSYDHSMQDGTGYYSQRSGPGLFADTFGSAPASDSRRDTSARPVDLPIRDDFKILGHALTAEWELTDNLSLKSISAYRELESKNLHDTVESFNIPAVQATNTEQNQVSQEFIVNGSYPAGALDYTVGLYYFEEQAEQLSRVLDVNNFLPLVKMPFDPVDSFRDPLLSDLAEQPLADVENKASAFYFNTTWSPSSFNRLSISLGARASGDKREIRRTSAGAVLECNDTKSNSVDPSITLDYQWTDDIHTYFTRAEGYRTGGFNLRSPVGTPPFDEERLVSYEIGLKSQWADRARVNLAVYRSEYTDMQLDFILPLSTEVRTINSGDATISGAEVQLDYAVLDSLDISLNYAYTDADQGGQVYDPFNDRFLIDTSIPFTPQHAYSLSAEYRARPFSFAELSLWVNYSWRDEHTANGGEFTASDPIDDYGLLDARLTLSEIPVGQGFISISLWGKNLEGKEYVTYHILSADIYGDPRSYGLDLNYQFN